MDFLAQLLFVVVVGGVTILLLLATNAAPDWATWPIMLSPLVVALLVLRIRPFLRGLQRIDCAGIRAEAEKPLDAQESYPYMKRYLSPDRRFVAVTGANEGRMGHWIESMAVYDVVRNRMILDLPDPWDVGTPEWGADNHLRFHARKYPGDVPGVDVDLDPGAGVARLHGFGEEITVKISRVLSSLNGFHKRSTPVSLNLFR